MKRSTFLFDSQIHYLPNELWNKIFSELDSLEMANFPLVSKWAYRLFWQCISFLKFRQGTSQRFLDLVFSKCNPIMIQTIVAVTGSIDDNACKCISQLVNLDTLLLRKCNITDKGIAYLASLRNISYMDISAEASTHITSDSLKWLQHTDSLCEIRITGLEANGPVLSNFSQLTNLSSLSLDTSSSTTIDDSEISNLAGLTKLQSLSLFSCSHSGNSNGYTALTCLVNLKFLGLHHQNFTVELCDIICQLTHLQKLALISKALRDEDIVRLSKRLSQLSTFNICGNISDLGITSLKNMLKLKEVDITSVNIGDESLQSLSEIPTLTKLYIRMSAHITDAGLRCLISLQKLSHLRLHCLDDITNEGLIPLLRKTSLRELNIINCPGITEAIITSVHDKLNIKLEMDKKEI